MEWEDLEVGDELEFTDKAKTIMERKKWNIIFRKLKKIVINDIDVINNKHIKVNFIDYPYYIYLNKDGTYCDDPSLTLFKIKKLRDD